MRPVRADFVRPRASLICWLAGIAVAAAAVWVWKLRAAQLEHAALKIEVAALQAAVDSSPAVAVPAPKPYDASARELLAQHESRWPELLAALEATAVDGVQLVALEFEATAASARIDIIYARPQQALSYLSELNGGLPVGDRAWRWSIVRMEHQRGEQMGRASLIARLSQ